MLYKREGGKEKLLLGHKSLEVLPQPHNLHKTEKDLKFVLFFPKTTKISVVITHYKLFKASVYFKEEFSMHKQVDIHKPALFLYPFLSYTEVYKLEQPLHYKVSLNYYEAFRK